MYSSQHEAFTSLPDSEEEDSLQLVVGLGVREEDHVEASVGGGKAPSLPSTPPDL